MSQIAPERRATLERMVTEDRAALVARLLFASDYSDGGDCRDEVGRKGEPCNVCAERNRAWDARVAEVRAAMIEAFR